LGSSWLRGVLPMIEFFRSGAIVLMAVAVMSAGVFVLVHG
jgi:hypothetical protein